MDEFAITPEPIRKRAKPSNKCDVAIDCVESSPSTSIISLPVEIIIEILSYLSNEHLHAVQKVSRFFQRIAETPCLWKTYEVTAQTENTFAVIKGLKKMPLLRKFSINGRADCDDILRQLSLTNRNLEELYVSNCTGSTSKLYLRSAYLIRILERCHNLHTIIICGSRFRGRKFYRLLGDMGTRLQMIYAQATGSQFITFLKYARQMNEADRAAISPMRVRVKSWAPLHYILTKQAGNTLTALISYLHSDFVAIGVNRVIQKCDNSSGSSPSG